MDTACLPLVEACMHTVRKVLADFAVSDSIAKLSMT